jgi:hypothetical protein
MVRNVEVISDNLHLEKNVLPEMKHKNGHQIVLLVA